MSKISVSTSKPVDPLAKQGVAVAYLLDWGETEGDSSLDTNQAEWIAQHNAVMNRAQTTNTSIVLTVTEAHRDLIDRPGLKLLLEAAQELGITRCLVGTDNVVFANDGYTWGYWSAKFETAGIELEESS